MENGKMASDIEQSNTFMVPVHDSTSLISCFNMNLENALISDVDTTNCSPATDVPTKDDGIFSALNGTLYKNSHDGSKQLCNGNGSIEPETDESETDCVCAINNESHTNDSSQSSSSNKDSNLGLEIKDVLVQRIASLSICNKDSRSSDNCAECNVDNIALSNETFKKAPHIEYISYKSELQMPDIIKLIQKDLSEPYSIYTYRYFIHNWPKLCFLAMHEGKSVGAIVCKLDMHRKVIKRGYIAMLAVDENYRKLKIGSSLVLKAIRAMAEDGADEVVLETEITNQPALRLYENLGFVRDKRLFRYYLNGVDALRLKLWLK